MNSQAEERANVTPQASCHSGKGKQKVTGMPVAGFGWLVMMISSSGGMGAVVPLIGRMSGSSPFPRMSRLESHSFFSCHLQLMLPVCPFPTWFLWSSNRLPVISAGVTYFRRAHFGDPHGKWARIASPSQAFSCQIQVCLIRRGRSFTSRYWTRPPSSHSE
jgi:hypothetical protein